MLAGVDVLGRDRDPPVGRLHVLARRDAVEVAPVREPAPRRVDLGQVGVVAPVAGLDDLQDPGAVRAGLGPEDPRRRAALVAVRGAVGVGVAADVVVLVGLVEAGDQADGVVEHRDHVREGVAEEARDPHDHVDAGPAELGERDGLQPDDAARRLVPGRQHAEQGEDLGDVVARGAHGRGAPDREPDRGRVLAGLVEVALQQRVGHRLAGRPGQPRGHGLGVDGVEVPAGRERVDQAAERRARRARPGRSRRRARAGCSSARRSSWPGAARPRGRRRRARPTTPGVRGAEHLEHDPVDARPRPSRASATRLHEGARLLLGGVGLGGAGLVLLEPERDAQAGDAVDLVGEHLVGPQHGQHEVDQVVARPAAGRGCAARRGSARP